MNDINTLMILNQVIKFLPGYIYYKGLNLKYAGCNQNFANLTGFMSPSQIIGLSDTDILSKFVNPEILVNNQKADQYVIDTKEHKTIDISIIMGDSKDAVRIVFKNKKYPLIDEKGDIVAIIGVLHDLTEVKENNYLDIDINFIVKNSPGYMYWKNLDSVYIGCNQNFASVCGFKHSSEIFNKTDYDLPWGLVDKGIAEKFIRNDKYVIETGNVHVSEDDNLTVHNENGLSQIVRSEKSPLLDKNGNLIGILGVAVDITDRLEQERLRAENDAQRVESQRQKAEAEKQHLLTVIEEQEKFRKIVNQVAHDIGSPIMAISVMLKSCENLPEGTRDVLRQATDRIYDIAHHLLNSYKSPEEIINNSKETNGPVLVSCEILSILSEKKSQYSPFAITFNHEISKDSAFIFINTVSSLFKRMISNLLNNAVEALPEKHGQIKLSVNLENNQLRVIIEDNGVGMPDEVKQKILNNIVVTANKVGGRGIGFEQIRDTLAKSDGILQIESNPGLGTKMILTFPTIEAPDWIATKIEFTKDNLIVILDDDVSVHGAWDNWLKSIDSEVKIKHFESGYEVIEFINDLSEAEKSNVILLSDYELLKERINGLDVISRVSVAKSILVTSHYANKKLMDKVQELNIKVLPKVLVQML